MYIHQIILLLNYAEKRKGQKEERKESEGAAMNNREIKENKRK